MITQIVGKRICSLLPYRFSFQFGYQPLESRNWIEPCSFFTRKIISTLPVPWLFGSFLSAIQRSQVKPGENETICVNPFSVKEVFGQKSYSFITGTLYHFVLYRSVSRESSSFKSWFRFGSACSTGFENRSRALAIQSFRDCFYYTIHAQGSLCNKNIYTSRVIVKMNY